jgi:hypothetical protein
LPELKRRVVIVDAKSPSNDLAIDVVRVCFHLDQSDSKSHLINVILIPQTLEKEMSDQIQQITNGKRHRCLKAWPPASHFVAALRST